MKYSPKNRDQEVLQIQNKRMAGQAKPGNDFGRRDKRSEMTVNSADEMEKKLVKQQLNSHTKTYNIKSQAKLLFIGKI